MATMVEQLDAIQEAKENGDWYPACGGTEKPFIARSGKRLLYCWQPSTGKHAYLDVDNDIILSNDDANYHIWGD